MSLPYFPFYVADYEADTLHLSAAEHGAFLRLLCLQWKTPTCTLPADVEWIRRRVLATDQEWAKAYSPVLSEFFIAKRGRIFSPRLLAEFERISSTSSKRSEAGRKGVIARKRLKTNETGSSRAQAGNKHLEPDVDSYLDAPTPEVVDEADRIVRFQRRSIAGEWGE